MPDTCARLSTTRSKLQSQRPEFCPHAQSTRRYFYCYLDVLDRQPDVRTLKDVEGPPSPRRVDDRSKVTCRTRRGGPRLLGAAVDYLTVQEPAMTCRCRPLSPVTNTAIDRRIWRQRASIASHRGARRDAVHPEPRAGSSSGRSKDTPLRMSRESLMMNAVRVATSRYEHLDAERCPGCKRDGTHGRSHPDVRSGWISHRSISRECSH